MGLQDEKASWVAGGEKFDKFSALRGSIFDEKKTVQNIRVTSEASITAS